ncbi:hypothetical protein [Microbacterium indicum]|uniref:hypothetical protein n=1 Tax=Microbacterium indicum TaxID=358100 RepID=UPI00048FFF77
MTAPTRTVAAADAAAATVRRVRETWARRVVIDGRSGAGKTTAARALVDAWPLPGGARLVSLDELYPGWGGLRAASPIAAGLLRAHAEGLAGEYRRWDWEREEWTPEAHVVDPGTALVVEGCGALTADAAAFADLAVWMDGDAAERRRRALDRDGELFEPYWDMWAEQEREHIAAEDPASLADIVSSLPPR